MLSRHTLAEDFSQPLRWLPYGVLGREIEPRNLFGAFAVGAIVVPMLPVDLLGIVWKRSKLMKRMEKTSALGRLHFWSVAGQMATGNPLLGVGFNGYNEAYDRYDVSDGELGPADRCTVVYSVFWQKPAGQA